MSPPQLDPDTLQRFARGDLPVAELEAVARLLDAYPDAAAGLDAGATGDAVTAAVRHAATLPPWDDPDLRAVAEQARRIAADGPTMDLSGSAVSADAGADPTPDDRTEVEDVLSVLTPPSAAGELGRLDGYRVLGVLGRGGMGVVFEAEDVKLGRRVALKVVAPALASKRAAHDRFLREARAAAAVEHDHIVPIGRSGRPAGSRSWPCRCCRGSRWTSGCGGPARCRSRTSS